MLYIMRHGRTDWNERHKLQGRTDIPLNANGRQMAEKAREEYADVHFDVCYCSPLIRARETAEIVLRGRNIPIIPDERLVEMSFGACEGMEYSFDKLGSPIADLFLHPEKYTEPVDGGESFEQLFARTGEFLREVAYPLVNAGQGRAYRRSWRDGFEHSLPGAEYSDRGFLERRYSQLQADEADVSGYSARTAHLIFVDRARRFFTHSSGVGRITSLATSL